MISYKVNNIEHKVTFCKSGNLGPISNYLDKINSDKNILLIYDDKINPKILKNIFHELKLSGCKVFSLKSAGSKKTKMKDFYLIY